MKPKTLKLIKVIKKTIPFIICALILICFGYCIHTVSIYDDMLTSFRLTDFFIVYSTMFGIPVVILFIVFFVLKSLIKKYDEE